VPLALVHQSIPLSERNTGYIRAIRAVSISWLEARPA
jgi:hypothetical protein